MVHEFNNSGHIINHVQILECSESSTKKQRDALRFLTMNFALGDFHIAKQWIKQMRKSFNIVNTDGNEETEVIQITFII